MTVWVPIGAAVLGASLGAFLAFFLARPRLSLLIDRIAITSNAAASIDRVQINSELRSTVLDFEFTLSEIGSVTAPERTYVAYLDLLTGELDAYREKITEMTAAADQLRIMFSTSDFDQGMNLYRLQQQDLWTWLEGMAAQSNAPTLNPSPVSAGAEDYPVLEDEDGNFIIDLPGVFGLVFRWSARKNVAGRERSRLFAESVAHAFSRRDSVELAKLFTALRNDLQRVATKTQKLRSDVESERARFNRLRVEFIATNSGRTALSLAPTAGCRIKLRGYPTREGGSVQLDPVLELRLFEARLEPQILDMARQAKAADLANDERSPFTLPGSTSMRFIATSQGPLSALASNEAIRTAFEGGERRLLLTIDRFVTPSKLGLLLPAKRSSLRRTSTRPVLFRNLQR